MPCFNMNAFCASENFDAFIFSRSSQPQGKYPKNSDSKWSSSQEADQTFFGFYDKTLLAYLMGQWLKVEIAHVGTSGYVRDNIQAALLAASHCDFIERSTDSNVAMYYGPSDYAEPRGPSR